MLHYSARVPFCAIIGLVFSVATCGNVSVGPRSPVVGGICTDNSQCQSICEKDPHYPDGICTFHCANNGDCPSGSVCTEDAGGICALSCIATADCIQIYGRDYACDLHKQHGAPDNALVCRKP